MDTKKIKEGVSVKEIESFAKKHRFEVFFCLTILLSCLFSFIFFSGFIALFTAVGGALGFLFFAQVEMLLRRLALFFYKQEDLTQLILGVAGLILSIFLPILTFFVLGVCGGKVLRNLSMMELHSKPEKKEEKE